MLRQLKYTTNSINDIYQNIRCIRNFKMLVYVVYAKLCLIIKQEHENHYSILNI